MGHHCLMSSDNTKFIDELPNELSRPMTSLLNYHPKVFQLHFPMNKSQVGSQVPKIWLSLSTFTTFNSFTNTMLHPHVSTKIELFIVEGLTPGLSALEVSGSMNITAVFSQQAKSHFSFTTFITFSPWTNSMLGPHVTKVKLPPRKQSRAVRKLAFQFGCPVDNSLMIC